MTIYFVYYMLALSACISVSIDISAAAIEQHEVKEKSAIEHAKSTHTRRHSTGKVKKKKKDLHIVTNVKQRKKKIDPRALTLQQEEDTPLMRAIKENNYAEVQRLVAGKTVRVNVGAQNKFRETPLMRAVEYNNRPITLLLLSRSAVDVNAQNKQGNTALMYAVREGNADLVDLLLKYHANPHVVNQEGWTLLMIAARRNDVENIKLLLSYVRQEEQQGVESLKNLVAEELSRVNSDEFTALHIAHQARAYDAQKILLEAAEIDYYDGWLLINAARTGDVKTVTHLLVHDVNVDYQYRGQTPLLAAVHGDSPQAMLEIVTQLLQAGANPNVLDRQGRSALVILAGRHFDKSWEVHMQDAPAFSALQCQIIKALLRAGATIESVIKRQLTPLIQAIMNYNLAVVQFLVTEGANIGAVYQGKTVLDRVNEVIEQLRKEYEKYPLLYTQWVHFKFDINVRLSSISGTVEGALLQAINYRDEKRVAELLNHMPKPNLKFLFGGFTPFSLAVDRGTPAIMELLIKAGANINQENTKGQTPLMRAILVEDWAAALYLLAHGAQVDRFDHTMNTALMYFASVALLNGDCLQVLMLLLERSIDVNARNKAGSSALDIIQKNTESNSFIKEQAIKMLQEAVTKQAETEKKVAQQV